MVHFAHAANEKNLKSVEIEIDAIEKEWQEAQHVVESERAGMDKEYMAKVYDNEVKKKSISKEFAKKLDYLHSKRKQLRSICSTLSGSPEKNDDRDLLESSPVDEEGFFSPYAAK